MVWLIRCQCWRLIVLLPSGTLHEYHPTPSKDVGQCKPIHEFYAMSKSKVVKWGTQLPRIRLWRKSIAPLTTWSMSFGFGLDDIKRCVSGSKKKHVLYWHIVPNTWLVKVGTNLSKEEVLVLEDQTQREHSHFIIGFQQLRPSPSLGCIFVCHWIQMPIQLPGSKRQCVTIQQHQQLITKQMGGCWTHGWLLCGWNHCHPISRAWSVNQHHLQGGYCVMCYNWWHSALHMSRLHENITLIFGKERETGNCNHLHYVFRLMCKVDYVSDKFIHASTFTYNMI